MMIQGAMTDSMIHLDNLRSLQTKNGLFLASSQGVSTGYDKAWLRDNVYEALAFEVAGEWDVVERVYHALLDIFRRHKDKIKWAKENKPFETWQYIHARYNPETFEEFWESWGNKQNDAVGAILFKLADFEERGRSMLRNDHDRVMVQTLIDYLVSIEYWHDADSGIWEEGEELHASSIGACLAALKRFQDIDGFVVPDEAILRGHEQLNALLPRESVSKFTDLALLSLIYPYNIVSDKVAREIVRNLEYHLERDKGLIRYVFDRYYNKNDDGHSEEAEWCFGLSWLAIVHKQFGEDDLARSYLQKAKATITDDNKIPELYYSHTNKQNENSPLGWAESMYVVAQIEVSGQK